MAPARTGGRRPRRAVVARSHGSAQSYWTDPIVTSEEIAVNPACSSAPAGMPRPSTTAPLSSTTSNYDTRLRGWSSRTARAS